MPTTLHEALRAGTATVHQELERLPLLDALARGAITPAQYGIYLAVQFRLHQGLEAALGPWVPPDWAAERLVKSRWLADDLASMGLAAEERCPPVVPVGSWGEALGVLYVLEGSTLGVRTVRARCPPGHPARQAASRFLQGYGERTGALWRGFVAVLDEAPADQWRSAVAKALETFGAFHAAMAEAGARTAAVRRPSGDAADVPVVPGPHATMRRCC
jgi:heme oxygenase